MSMTPAQLVHLAETLKISAIIAMLIMGTYLGFLILNEENTTRESGQHVTKITTAITISLACLVGSAVAGTQGCESPNAWRSFAACSKPNNQKPQETQNGDGFAIPPQTDR